MIDFDANTTIDDVEYKENTFARHRFDFVNFECLETRKWKTYVLTGLFTVVNFTAVFFEHLIINLRSYLFTNADVVGQIIGASEISETIERGIKLEIMDVQLQDLRYKRCFLL
jgi:hypothetical protein